MSNEIIPAFIYLEFIVLNKARIAQRVELGAHAVNDAKVEQRIPFVSKNVEKTLALCDEVYVLDNSSTDNPCVIVACYENSVLTEGANYFSNSLE